MPNDIFEVLESEEQIYNKSIAGAHIYPIIRYLIGTKDRKRVDAARAKVSNFDVLKELISNSFKFIVFLFRVRKENVFISSENNMSSINNVLYDRVVDPIIEKAGKENCSKLSFSMFRKDGKKYIASKLNVSFVIKLYSIAVFPFVYFVYKKELSDYREKLLSCLRKNNLDRDFFSSTQLARIMSDVIASKHLFVLIANFCKTKKLYVSNCYSLETIGAILAFNSRELETFNIQHGVQSYEHFAFGFSNSPRETLNTIPQLYLNWDSQSAAGIEKVSEVEVIGYVWREFVRNISKLNRDSYKEYNKLVLITTQPTTGVIIDELTEVIKSNTECFFFYRLHPSQNNDENINKLQNVFSGLENVDFSGATKLALPLILEIVDLHVTGFSSTVLDAYYFDVPSVTFHHKAISYYAAFKDTNMVHFSSLADLKDEFFG